MSAHRQVKHDEEGVIEDPAAPVGSWPGDDEEHVAHVVDEN
jgi:hypothetical protein